MNTSISDIEIFNELSEFITLRIKSYREHAHDGFWVEHKVHPDYDLWFIQSGTIKIHIGETEHTVNPGDVVFFYPQHSYMADTIDEGCHFINVHFDFEIGEQRRILDDFHLSGVIAQELIHEETILFIKSFIQMQQSNMPGNRLYLKACLMAVIAKVIEIHGKGLYTGAFLNGSIQRNSKRCLDILQPVFKYINDHLSSSIKIGELAVLVVMSEKYFISYFKKYLGITPGQYIYQIKMNRARDYLYEQKYTIQQIASFLGYSDSFAFSNAFKKYYNVPPSKFV
jgi:AraC-type DNA-binding domain-containing proteins